MQNKKKKKKKGKECSGGDLKIAINTMVCSGETQSLENSFNVDNYLLCLC